MGGKAKPPEKEKKKVVQEHGKKAEEVQRKEGLESAIPASNIGFKMLQQMGYTAGTALGKHGQGLLEPVNIDLKRSRTGLGRDRAAEEEQEAKARRAEVEAMRNRQKETALRADFQERRRDSWHSRKTVGDYRKACATYLQLEESSPTSASAEQPDKGDEQRAPSVDDDVSTTGKSEEKAEKGEKAEKTEEEEEEEEEITPEVRPVALAPFAAFRFLPISKI